MRDCFGKFPKGVFPCIFCEYAEKCASIIKENILNEFRQEGNEYLCACYFLITKNVNRETLYKSIHELIDENKIDIQEFIKCRECDVLNKYMEDANYIKCTHCNSIIRDGDIHEYFHLKKDIE